MFLRAALLRSRIVRRALKTAFILLNFSASLTFAFLHVPSVEANQLAVQAAGNSVAPGQLYTTPQRWGFGFDPDGKNKTLVPLGSYNYTAITGALFQNWTAEDAKGPYTGLDYYPMVGAWFTYAPGDCVNITGIIKRNPSHYPDGTHWIVGNEIGYDIAVSPQAYAKQFLNWRDCLKNIAAANGISYSVGAGAVLDERIMLPGHTGKCAPSLDYHSGSIFSGYAYWKAYVKAIKNIDASKLPDFYTAHGYSACASPAGPGNAGWWNVKYFRTQITDYRTLMQTMGVQDKELIINEFAPLYHDPSRQVTPNNYIKYMCDTTKFMLNQTDTAIGNPNDDFHLVQRWMWFNSNVGQGSGTHFPDLALFSGTNALTKLGRAYDALTNSMPDNCGSWAAAFQ